MKHESDFAGVLAACPEDSDLFIAAPQEMEALSGSCVQIPCTFRAKSEEQFNSTRPTYGVWFNSDPRFYKGNVIFNSSQAVNTYPVNLTGSLSQKNCTTLFSNLIIDHTNTYFFRIESQPYQATGFCDPVQIVVKGKRVFFQSIFN